MEEEMNSRLCKDSHFGVLYKMRREVSSFFPLVLTLGVLEISNCQAEVLTFDVPPLPLGINVATFPDSPYHGLYWNNNWSAVNAVGFANSFGTNGYFLGMVSSSNVATRSFVGPQEIYSLTTNFNFLGAYLTGVFNSNLNIKVEGFSGTNLLYDQTVIASATSPTLFTFNYLNIDRVTFNSFGGDVAFTNGSGARFAMDNFTFELVPEPSSLLLTTAGMLLLITAFTRKRPK
jgi:hypothetical protein